MTQLPKIVFMGATGAVGSAAFQQLLTHHRVEKLLTLGRRAVEISDPPTYLKQELIDIHQPESYATFIVDHDVAICTLGVGEPSKISKEKFVAIDKTAVLHFARVCKDSGVRQFHLLSSVGANSSSWNYYLRTKGELNDALVALHFDRLCIYQPSMIMTPHNRYGWTQGLALKIWPRLEVVLRRGLRKYRGIKVEALGKAIANNVFVERRGVEYLHYDDFLNLQS